MTREDDDKEETTGDVQMTSGSDVNWVQYATCVGDTAPASCVLATGRPLYQTQAVSIAEFVLSFVCVVLTSDSVTQAVSIAEFVLPFVCVVLTSDSVTQAVGIAEFVLPYEYVVLTSDSVTQAVSIADTVLPYVRVVLTFDSVRL